MQFTAGDPAQVVVVLTDQSVVVSEFAGVWESPFTLAPRPRRVGVLKWRRLPETSLFTALTSLIKGAREARQSRSHTGLHCGNRTPPECRHDRGVGHPC